MRLLTVAAAAVALTLQGQPCLVSAKDADGGRAGRVRAKRDGPGAKQERGPLAAACDNLEEESACTVSRTGGGEGQKKESKASGVCKKMLDGDLHCHILHPSQLACLAKEEGMDCSYAHRGTTTEEKGTCSKQPHGMVCNRDEEAKKAAKGERKGESRKRGDRGDAVMRGKDRIEQLADACSNKKAGDPCAPDSDSDNDDFAGVCESRASRREKMQRDAKKKSKTRKEDDVLRCRMVSPLEAACLQKEDGDACKIGLHTHGNHDGDDDDHDTAEHEGVCSTSVRGDLHCRHKKVARPERGGEGGGMKKPIKGSKKNNLRAFPAPKQNSPAPSAKDGDDDPNRKAPAPRDDGKPSPGFQDKP